MGQHLIRQVLVSVVSTRSKKIKRCTHCELLTTAVNHGDIYSRSPLVHRASRWVGDIVRIRHLLPKTFLYGSWPVAIEEFEGKALSLEVLVSKVHARATSSRKGSVRKGRAVVSRNCVGRIPHIEGLRLGMMVATSTQSSGKLSRAFEMGSCGGVVTESTATLT